MYIKRQVIHTFTTRLSLQEKILVKDEEYEDAMKNLFQVMALEEDIARDDLVHLIRIILE